MESRFDHRANLTVNTISEKEARQLLNRPLFCEEWSAWKLARSRQSTLECAAGILNENFRDAGMVVVLRCACGAGRTIVSFAFSVYKRNRYGTERSTNC